VLADFVSDAAIDRMIADAQDCRCIRC